MASAATPPPLDHDARAGRPPSAREAAAVVGIHDRLSTRVILLQAAVLLLALFFTYWRFQSQQEREAVAALRDAGEGLLPLLVPELRVPLFLAYDEATGRVDENQLQTHVIERRFEDLVRNQDLAYAELMLPDGKSIIGYLRQGLDPSSLEAAYGGLTLADDAVLRDTDLLVARQATVTTADGKTQLATLRLAYSLARTRARAIENLYTTVGLGVLVFLVAVAVTILLGRVWIYRPISELVRAATQVASGRLSATSGAARQRGELALLGRAFDGMASALRRIVAGIKSTSGGVQVSASAIDASSTSMLEGARKQSASVDQIYRSVSELDASTRAVDDHLEQLTRSAFAVDGGTEGLSGELRGLDPKVNELSRLAAETDVAMRGTRQSASEIVELAEGMATAAQEAESLIAEFGKAGREIERNATRSNDLSSAVATQARDSQQVITQAADAMDGIGGSFDAMDAAVHRLGARIDGISRVLDVIDAVTSQTKLLSLNASILAAQAGEHGRGFAIVADEIKGLSERTVASTREIDEIIKELRADRDRTGEAMAAGRTAVGEGRSLSQSAAEAIAVILRLSAESRDEAAEIAAATRMQVTATGKLSATAAQLADQARGVRTRARAQEEQATSVSEMTAHMVGAADEVAAALVRQVQLGTEVARQVKTILRMAEAVHAQSGQQHSSTGRILESVTTIRDVAGRLVGDAERVVRDMQTLAAHLRRLGASIETFQLG